MKVYFSCSITGGRCDEAVYAALVAHLQSLGHEVLTAHLASPTVMEQERAIEAQAVYERDCAWVRGSDVVIAEVSTPSHGVGYEVAYALEHGRPVLCLHRDDARVSKMLTGNSRSGIEVHPYPTPLAAVQAMEAFLARIDPAPRS